MFEKKNGHNEQTYCKIRNIKETLQTKTQYKPQIWPPTMKYLLLTSHFSDCFSGRGVVSAAYNYCSQLAHYSKTFWLGCVSLSRILKAPWGRLWQSGLCTKMLCIEYTFTLFRYFKLTCENPTNHKLYCITHSSWKSNQGQIFYSSLLLLR